METLRFDLSKTGKPFKILNAVNGGPWHRRHADDQYRSNLEDYKAARIPFSRNHDSAVCGIYGGPYSHDITCIFPDFDADPYDPSILPVRTRVSSFASRPAPRPFSGSGRPSNIKSKNMARSRRRTS